MFVCCGDFTMEKRVGTAFLLLTKSSNSEAKERKEESSGLGSLLEKAKITLVPPPQPNHHKGESVSK